MKELDTKTHKKIKEFSKLGDSFFDDKNYDLALKQYNFALELVPLPKNDWEASTWLYTAIGDVYFAQNLFDKASNAFYEALNCPGGIGNPFIYLRLGQSLFELNNIEKSEEYLMSAYMLEGKKIFKGEKKKYLKHLQKFYEI
jgi:tetratricopeptide (TPR) repeat protein